MALEVGDVIRMRMVATVTAIEQTTLTVTSYGGTPVTFPKAINNDPGFTYEEVAEAEPVYLAGELYRDANGSVFQRMATEHPGDRWRVLLHPRQMPGVFVGEGFPVRPLTHLVPEQTSSPAPE
jgi:hypothetical protein